MHPSLHREAPGACPICGMELIDLIEPDTPHGTSTDGSPGASTQVELSERARVKAQIRTTPVRRLALGFGERRLLGRVDYDETTLRTVTSWISGRIDHLHVRVTGERVTQGQIIATLYSPEVYSASQDLIQASRQFKLLSNSASPAAQEAARAARHAARDRLRLLGLPEAEFNELGADSKPSEQVHIRTPFGGTVIERLATEGSYVSTGSGLYRIADLSKLWVQLDAYESDLPLLGKGQEVSLEVSALPAKTFNGRVTFVAPILNERTRTVRVRLEVSNQEGLLRPGMFAAAIVRGSMPANDTPPLVIPQSAPLFTGRRSLVYVEIPKAKRPTYQARVVQLGPKTGSFYPVLKGLMEGERVVIHGAFALDADLQISGGSSMMTLPDEWEEKSGKDAARPPAPPRHSH